jgi:anti-sigma B factor antagonist
MYDNYDLRVYECSGVGVRLEVRGEVDLAVAPNLLDSVLCAAFSHDRHTIVVDLANTTFMDSSALAALVEADRRLRQASAHLVIANPSATITKAFEVSGLDGHLDIRRQWTTNAVADGG